MNPNTKRLHDLGQSLWLDSISREMLVNGTLARYISELSITGLTSNPTIFEHAIGAGSFYDAAIRALAHVRPRLGAGPRQRLQPDDPRSGTRRLDIGGLLRPRPGNDRADDRKLPLRPALATWASQSLHPQRPAPRGLSGRLAVAGLADREPHGANIPCARRADGRSSPSIRVPRHSRHAAGAPPRRWQAVARSRC